jgi:XTP/dITP diphosphohydrolase
MRLVIATRNAHKVEEIRAILGGAFEYLTLRDLHGAPEAIEDADTFEGNAAKKAATLASWLTSKNQADALVLADDSGLEVDALNGAPGVHSARFAALDDPTFAPGKNSPDRANNEKLLRLLAKVPEAKRTARFRCALALIAVPNSPAAVEELAANARFFSGACEGWIAFAPSGSGGFGYDPLFMPVGHERSFAELGEDVKNRMSHRGKALAELRRYFAGGASSASP